ncbi:MAG: peptidase U32 family protein [Desulfovibrio sp.]
MTKCNSIPELLAPAGNREKLETAVSYGADAVYLGGESMNLRAGAGGFSFDTLPEAVQYAHSHGVKVYFCLNGYPQENQLATITEYLIKLDKLQAEGTAPDALIIADFGIVLLAQEHCPNIPIHISTQANTGNSSAVKFWAAQGMGRVNVAREVTAPDLKTMKKECPDTELEVFVHGAMCMSLSGRCFLSAWLNDRSGNMGSCTHPCRFEYTPLTMTFGEKTRPGEPSWTVEEERLPNGEVEYTKFFAAHDMCLIGELPQLVKNAAAIKIEGRTKTSSYLAQVVDAYRTALDDLQTDSFDARKYLPELLNTATRPYSTGFYGQNPRQAFAQPPADDARLPMLARVLEKMEDKTFRLAVKTRFSENDDLVFVAKGLRRPVLKSGDYTLTKTSGEPTDNAKSGMEILITVNDDSLLPEIQYGLFFRTAGKLS